LKLEELVIVTQDIKKGDWVYTPKKFRDEKGRLQENAGTLTLPHPLLVQEAQRECPTLKVIHVVSVSTFALVLRNELGYPLPKLVAALQSEDELGGRKQPRSPPARGRDDDGTARNAGPEITFRSSDLSYDFPRDDEVDRVIRALRVQDWRVQNEAVQELNPFLTLADRDQLVQIGRAVATAINASAVEPLEFLIGLLDDAKVAPAIRANILVGVLAQIYLDDTGELKKPEATPELANLLFASRTDSGIASAYESILGRLQPQRRAYLALPTDSVGTFDMQLTLERGGETAILRGANIGEAELLEEAAPESRRLFKVRKDVTVALKELLYRMSREFVVPVQLFKVDLPDSAQLLVPEAVGFARWGPNTGVMLR
jgi:hypothetical protein